MIGKRIRRLRQERGYSITFLAKEAKISKSYLSHIERDLQQNPSLQVLSKLADALETTIEYLLEEVESVTHEKHPAIDKEWEILYQYAVDEGLSKEDLIEFKNFVTFKNWLDEQKIKK